MPYISVIFPAYNEAERIRTAIFGVVDQFRDFKADIEILVINNGSTDKTRQVATAAALDALQEARKTGHITFRLLDSRKGKGAAVRAGLAAAAGTWILISDVDLATPLREVHKMIRAAQQDPPADLVIGSRKLKGSLVLGFGIKRRITSGIFSLLARILTPVPAWIHDTQCGFKLLTAAAAADLWPRLQLDGFTYDVELLAAARLNGYRIREVPVIWTHDTDSRVNVLTDSVNMAADLLVITRNWARNVYTG